MSSLYVKEKRIDTESYAYGKKILHYFTVPWIDHLGGRLKANKGRKSLNCVELIEKC